MHRVGSQLVAWLACVLLAAPLAVPVAATTLHRTAVSCPICGQRLPALEFGSRFIGAYATDLMPWDGSLLEVGPVTCTRCLFTGHEDEFDAAERSGPLRWRLRAWLRPPVPVAPHQSYETLPMWARYDLLAQVRTILGQPASEVAAAWMLAAWCERRRSSWNEPLHHELDEPLRSVVAARTPQVVRRGPHRGFATAEVEYALRLLARLPAARADEQPARALVAVELLRQHGEHRWTLRAWDAVRPSLQGAERRRYERRLLVSLERERRYQRRALDGFLQALADEPPGGETGLLLYRCAELSRRLDELPAALRLYDRALAAGLPDWLLGVAREQRTRAAAALLSEAVR